MTGANMLAAWLAEDAEYEVVEIASWPTGGWRCVLDTGRDAARTTKAFGPTPDAAMQAAVEAARRESK